MDLVIDRDVRVLFSVGKRTADKLYGAEIYTVSNLLDREDEVIGLLGRQGSILLQLARGIDGRKVIPYRPEDAKSISRELTFQRDVHDYKLLEDVLLLMSMSVAERAKRHRLHGNGVVLKITFSNMRSITRSKASVRCDDALSIHRAAVGLLSTVKKQGVRLIGVGIYNLSKGIAHKLLFGQRGCHVIKAVGQYTKLVGGYNSYLCFIITLLNSVCGIYKVFQRIKNQP